MSERAELITLNDGTIFSDVDSSSVIAKVFGYTDEMFRFTQFKLLNVNDSIIVVNTTTNELEIKTISSIKYSYNKETIYKLEVEESDLYLTMEEETTSPIYALIQHNVYGSCQNNCCNYAYWTCNSPCGGNYSYDGYAYNVGVCCADGFFYCYSYDYYYGMCPYCCDQVFCGSAPK